MEALSIKLSFKEVGYTSHDHHINKDSALVHVENYQYEVKGEGTNGIAYCHHLSYDFDLDAAGNTPILFRGFMHFVGTFNHYEGEFLAQEDGVFKASGNQVCGRIVDASQELVMLTGQYEYSFDPPHRLKLMNSKIDNKQANHQTQHNDDRQKCKHVDVYFDIEL